MDQLSDFTPDDRAILRRLLAIASKQATELQPLLLTKAPKARLLAAAQAAAVVFSKCAYHLRAIQGEDDAEADA